MAASDSFDDSLARAIAQAAEPHNKVEQLTSLAREAARQLEQRDDSIAQLQEEIQRLTFENQELRDKYTRLAIPRPTANQLRLRQPGGFKVLIEDVEAAREEHKSSEAMGSKQALEQVRKHISTWKPKIRDEAVEGRSWPVKLTLTDRKRPPKVSKIPETMGDDNGAGTLSLAASSIDDNPFPDAEAEILDLRKRLGMENDPRAQQNSLKRKCSSDVPGSGSIR